MLNVINNETVKKIANTPNANYVGVILKNGRNVAVAIGETEKEAHDEAYVTWAVMWDYEGRLVTLPVEEITW